MPQPPFTPSHSRDLARQSTRAAGLERRGAGPWHYIGTAGEPAFENSWTNVGGVLTDLRFRQTLGGAVQIEGSVMGGVDGSVVFTLPVGYRPDDELRLAASDDVGDFVVFRVLADGSVIFGLS